MQGLDKAVLIELGVTLRDFLQEIFIKLSVGRGTRVPISKRMGGAEMTASFSELPSERRERVSGISSAGSAETYLRGVFEAKIFIISRISSFDYK